MHRFTPPVTEFDDTPTITLTINGSWASFVDGALSPLLNPNIWDGDEVEVEFAIQQIEKILGVLGGG